MLLSVRSSVILYTETDRDTVNLSRERQFVSGIARQEGMESLSLARVLVTEAKHIPIIETKMASLDAAMGQCLLALKYIA